MKLSIFLVACGVLMALRSYGVGAQEWDEPEISTSTSTSSSSISSSITTIPTIPTIPPVHHEGRCEPCGWGACENACGGRPSTTGYCLSGVCICGSRLSHALPAPEAEPGHHRDPRVRPVCQLCNPRLCNQFCTKKNRRRGSCKTGGECKCSYP